MRAAVQQVLDALFGRFHGPLAFRLIIQPVMSIALGISAGLKDAREGRPPYGWTVLTCRGERLRLLHECWRGVAKVFIVAIIIDLVYEVIVYRWIYPGQAVLVATVLAVFPYLLIRGPANRIARRWRS